MMARREERTGIVPQNFPYRELPVISKEKTLEIRERVRARYEGELARAPWWKKFLIQLKMFREFKRELMNSPSPHSLYATKEKKS
jgi:hypothetical protein